MGKLIIVLLLIYNITLFSQTPTAPVNWQVTYNETSSNLGELIYTASIDDKWHIYSQKLTDAGPIPTSFIINTDTLNFKLIGIVEEENAHEEYVTAFDAKVFVFEKQAVFKQKIKRLSKKAFVIKTSLEYMCCNDSKCLPPKTLEFTIEIPEKIILKSKL